MIRFGTMLGSKSYEQLREVTIKYRQEYITRMKQQKLNDQKQLQLQHQQEQQLQREQEEEQEHERQDDQTFVNGSSITHSSTPVASPALKSRISAGSNDSKS